MLFEYLNSINTSKEYLMIDSHAEKNYQPFMINRGLSMFEDTCLFANEMNRCADIPKRMQYDFYLNAVSKKKRFSKWAKKDKESDDLNILAEHFNVSLDKARIYLGILTQQQLEEIRVILNPGGITK